MEILDYGDYIENPSYITPETVLLALDMSSPLVHVIASGQGLFLILSE